MTGAGRPAELAVLAETVQQLRAGIADLPGPGDDYRIMLSLEGADLHAWVDSAPHEARRDCPCGPSVREVTREGGGDGAIIVHPIAGDAP